MNNELEQLKKRVTELEKKLNSVFSSSKMPIEFERALVARGFMRNDDLFLSGTGYLTVGGTFTLEVPVEKKSIPFAIYATAGVDIGTLSAVIRASTTSASGNELYVEGIGGAQFYYLIFKSVDKSQYTS